MPPQRIYLDNAATSFPKPPGVYEAMLDFGTRVGASPGRGHYSEAREAAKLIRRCRERLCRLINGENPDHVIFTLNTTDALNLAIKGIVRQRRLDSPGKPIHLITTRMDHNSILRPFHSLLNDGDVTWTLIDADQMTGRVAPSSICNAIRPNTALVALSHASNVFGTLQPIAAIAELCRKANVPILIDAAQSLGHVPIDVQSLNIDLLAFPGHKGLLGPQGTGGLYIRPGIEGLLANTREGGTGFASDSHAHPHELPLKLEAGTLNAIGIVGLSEAIAYLLARGIDSVQAHELDLMQNLLHALRKGGCRLCDGTGGEGPLAGLRLVGPCDPQERVGVFSFSHDSLSSAEMATLLESRHGILARSGVHCAPHALASLNPNAARHPADTGTFRISFSPFTTTQDIHNFLAATHEICAGMALPAARATPHATPSSVK